MKIRIECPKCASPNAYYQFTEVDKILRCLCGYHKVIETTLETIVVMHNDSGPEVKLPRRGTNIWLTLSVLAAAKTLNSAAVTRQLNDAGHKFTVSDVSSYLTILRSKGLVYNTELRRGLAGGSTWALTPACLDILNL